MDRRRPRLRLFAALVLATSLGALAAAEEQEEQAPDAAAPPARFSAGQLDQMVAPVALYPDALLMQVLIASTYPLEIVEADRWRRQNATLKDDAVDKALEAKDWDPSVEGLTHFPELLKRMSENLDWTKDLGDAFLDQKDDLLDAVQRMRRHAQDAGTLKTTKEQSVSKEVVGSKETIVIQQADPQVVYVPTYPPTAYGPTYATPSYPAVYGYTPGQMATASLLSFGVGIGVGALISNGCDWGHHDVYVNNNYYGGGGGGGKNGNTNVNVNKNRTTNVSNRQKWEHNPEHRRNVGYRDQRTAQRFQGRDPAAARDRQRREQARGYDRGTRGGGMQTANLGGEQRGQRADRGDLGRPGGTGPGGPRPETRPARGTTGGRQDAFGGYGSGRDTRQASQRGASSRGGQSWAGSGGGGSRGGFGGGGRGGGGGGGGGRGGSGGGGGRGGGGRGGGRGGGGGRGR